MSPKFRAHKYLGQLLLLFNFIQVILEDVKIKLKNSGVLVNALQAPYDTVFEMIKSNF